MLLNQDYFLMNVVCRKVITCTIIIVEPHLFLMNVVCRKMITKIVVELRFFFNECCL